ncbi:MAG: glycerate kinase [Dehalococcoidia bacterium]
MPVFLIAPQEFKGSLTAVEAARAIAAGVRDAVPGASVVLAPMSDGGAGLVDALLAARGGERITTATHDPLMRPVDAVWALLRGGGAAIEMAAASGLVLLSDDERDPLVATTYGTGELIRAALDRGCGEIIVGVGGSATVDGGAGAVQALGGRLLDGSGAGLPPGGAPLARLERIDLAGVDRRLAGARLRVASDVRNRLCGAEGAAAVFGPQKGASAADIGVLDAALARFAEVVRRQSGIDLLSLEGGGAAGGLAAGLRMLGASVEPGFALVASAVGLDGQVARADIVITGEGRLDAQTSYGKTAAGVAGMARAHGKRAIAVAGSIADGDARAIFDVAVAATPPGMAVADAMRDAAALVRAAAARAVRGVMGGAAGADAGGACAPGERS